MSDPNAEIVGYLRADVRRAVERYDATVTVVTAEAALALADLDRITAERDAARAEAARLREALRLKDAALYEANVAKAIDMTPPTDQGEGAEYGPDDPEFYGCTPEECATTPTQHCCIPPTDQGEGA